MNDLQVFGFEGRNVRVVEKDGSPWWVLADVCEILDLDQVSRAADRLDDDEHTLLKVTHPQSKSTEIEVNAVNESGLYTLILRSNKPEAKAFKKWITSEVLPAIRKTGVYGSIRDFTLPSAPKMREIRMFLKMGVIEKSEARAALFQPKGVVKRDPLSKLPDSSPEIRPLVAFFDRPEFGGIQNVIESLEKNPRSLEHSGMARRVHKGVPELLVEHEHKVLTKIIGKGYKVALRKDPAYRGTVQAHVARNQVSCLVFDWKSVRG